MSDYEKPFADAGAPKVTPVSGRPSTSARRVVAQPIDAPILDISSTENRPYSIGDEQNNTITGRRLW